MCDKDNKLQDPFDTSNQQEVEKVDKNNLSQNNWRGVLYFFPWCKYHILLALWGNSAVQTPKPFVKTGNIKVLYHGGFFIAKYIKCFFLGPFKESQDLNFIEKLTLLLEPGNFNEEILRKSKDLTYLHRIYENTKARRRLEKWASRVIILYLLIVLGLVLGNYTTIGYPTYLSFMNRVKMSIPPSIMITILSTTTVNIIGLGLIVLRGHFLNKDYGNDLSDDVKRESEITQL